MRKDTKLAGLQLSFSSDRLIKAMQATKSKLLCLCARLGRVSVFIE